MYLLLDPLSGKKHISETATYPLFILVQSLAKNPKTLPRVSTIPTLNTDKAISGLIQLHAIFVVRFSEDEV